MALHKSKLAWLLALCCFNGVAAPYIPTDGDQILERVPARNDPRQSQLRALRSRLDRDPQDIETALRLSRLYIDMWRGGGDPRYLGSAQAALRPWWGLAEPPVPVQVMRATLLQSTHQFQAALSDLNAVVRRDPDNAQAWLTRASILQVVGEYPEATKSCEHLVGRTAPLVVATCLAGIGSVSGRAAQSYRQLSQAVELDRGRMPDILLWAETLLAEMAERRGDASSAQRHFRAAQSASTPDNYLLAAYADFLLRQGQYLAVVQLLESRKNVDALLLRHCIALKLLQRKEAIAETETLTQGFKAAEMRGDRIHLREQARFALEVTNDVQSALRLAKENWKVQKEPTDTILLLQAALAANDRDAAKPVLEWSRDVGLEDVRVDALRKQLKARP